LTILDGLLATPTRHFLKIGKSIKFVVPIKQVEIRLPTQLQKEEESEHKNYIYDCMNILAMT
jgi:hypothetical protein